MWPECGGEWQLGAVGGSGAGHGGVTRSPPGSACSLAHLRAACQPSVRTLGIHRSVPVAPGPRDGDTWNLGSSQEPQGSPWLRGEEGGRREPPAQGLTTPLSAPGRTDSGPPPHTALAWEAGGPGPERGQGPGGTGEPPWPTLRGLLPHPTGCRTVERASRQPWALRTEVLVRGTGL